MGAGVKKQKALYDVVNGWPLYNNGVLLFLSSTIPLTTVAPPTFSFDETLVNRDSNFASTLQNNIFYKTQNTRGWI